MHLSLMTHEEIKQALFDIEENKAPGIDGFNALFLKKTWIIIQQDVCKAVRDFFQQGKLLRAVNHTVVTLIPKTSHPESIRDYRPIAYCTTIYKIISNIISSRISSVICKTPKNRKLKPKEKSQGFWHCKVD